MKLGCISGNHVEAVADGGGRDETIRGRNDEAFPLRIGGNLAPNPADFEINWQEAVHVVLFQGLQPRRELDFSLAVAQERDSLSNLAHRENTNEKVRWTHVAEGGVDARIRDWPA